MAETKRLIIRPYETDDVDAVWQVVRREEIYTTTYAIPKDYTRERVEWWISFVENCRKNGTSLEFGMFDKKSGRYIGNCGLINIKKQHKSADICYFIDPDLFSMGYATEGAEAMLSLAFYVLTLNRVGGVCMTINPASRRVMEKLGFLYEGTGRSELLKDGTFYDLDHLSILRDEFITTRLKK